MKIRPLVQKALILLSISFISGCNIVHRPKHGSFVTVNFSSFMDFDNYLKKQDQYRNDECNFSFNYSLCEADSCIYKIEGIDITGQYKKVLSKDDYNDLNFYIMSNRYPYIVNTISDTNLILGFATFKEAEKNKESLHWVEIYGNIKEKYGESLPGSREYDYFTDVCCKEEYSFLFSDYSKDMKYGLSLRNIQNKPIAFLFSNCDSFNYFETYKTNIIERI